MMSQPKYFTSKYYDKKKDILDKKASKDLKDEYEYYHKEIIEGKGKNEIVTVR